MTQCYVRRRRERQASHLHNAYGGPATLTRVPAIPVYALVFAVLTAVWCVIGYKLVTNRAAGGRLRRYGHIALPIVLVALGLHILVGARALLR